jgi:predicted ATPase/DNA-binding winged helix-turn-helix (wHTH) protein
LRGADRANAEKYRFDAKKYSSIGLRAIFWFERRVWNRFQANSAEFSSHPPADPPSTRDPSVTTDARFVFGDVELRASERRLLIGGQAANIGSRAFNLLLMLVTHRDRMVTKDELIEAVWPNVVVDQNNLVVQIASLRKLLGNQAIVTIPGRGYKFSVPDVQVLRQHELPRRDQPLAAPLRHAPLVGRREEVRRVSELLRTHRVVTLTGASGIGKTRLAQHLCDELSPAFRDGSAWVDLASASDGRLVIDALARPLGLDLRAADPLPGLMHAMQDRRMLMVIDNVEAVADGVARVVHALCEAAPGVRFLLTSQVPLRITLEKELRLGPLSVPTRLLPAAEALTHGAVALFAERAQAMDHRFTLDDSNAGAVIGICRRLDGIALAIEMAASRVSLLGVDELSQALEQRLDLLLSSRKDVPERHQTLRRALDWSHGLLTDAQRVALRRLSVFTGSFPLEAALDVLAGDESGAPGSMRWDGLDALTELVDRSLVIVEPGEPPRYRLYESTRQFAAEQLAASGEQDDCRRRHALAMRRIVLALFEERLRDWDRAHACMALELDNAREALAWALRADPLTAVMLAPPISWGLVTSSTAALDIWRATEALLSDDMPVPVLARWAGAASIFRLPSWLPRRLEWARTAIDLWRRTGEREGLQVALLNASRLMAQDDPAQCRVWLAEADALNAPGMAPGIRAMRADVEAQAALDAGDIGAAITAFEQALRAAAAARNSFIMQALSRELTHARMVQASSRLAHRQAA